MGHAIAFDTLAYSKRLIAVGMPPRQAEEQIEIFAEILDNNLATKQDIELIHKDMKELEGSLQRDMKELEGSLQRDMKELEMRMIIRLGSIMTAGIAIVAALVKLL